MQQDRQTAETWDKGHGRVEHRRLTAATLLNDYAAWPGLKQVCRLTRTITRRGQTTTEVQYAITSVGREQAEAARLLCWWRGHWRIENQVHWVRDETFGEDRCRVRTGTAPQILSSIRNLAMNWLRSQKIDTIAAALRENAWNPRPLFAKLGRWNH